MSVSNLRAERKPDTSRRSPASGTSETEQIDYLTSLSDHVRNLVLNEVRRRGSTQLAKYLGAALHHAIRDLAELSR